MSPTSVTTFSFQVGIALKDSLSVVENTRTQAWAPKNIQNNYKCIHIKQQTNIIIIIKRIILNIFQVWGGFPSFFHKSALLPPACDKQMVRKFPKWKGIDCHIISTIIPILPDGWVWYFSNHLQQGARLQRKERGKDWKKASGSLLIAHCFLDSFTGSQKATIFHDL